LAEGKKVQMALDGVAAKPERLILETSDEQFVRKLHSMRAARSVLEHDGGRWEITRISGGDGNWQVYGRRARRP
jgi:hypothetical protein